MSVAESLKPKRAWWKEACVYQIYPASFKDSSGDGIGDIPGILSKVDYIKKIGVDAVWLCPAYKSPQVDMGYDVADYKQIDERYGTVADVEELVKQLHSRGIKFLMDLVVNHTSDQHEWFKSAISSKDSEFRNFYTWKKPKYDAQGSRQPPNNWSAAFGGSAWTYDEKSDEYYLNLFCPEQPDLNWEHPPVIEAVHDIMRFWLDKGVDGFRMDVINFISKDTAFPDAKISFPKDKYQPGTEHYAAGPRLHEFLQGLGSILNEYNACSVGEMPGVGNVNDIIQAVGFDKGELNMIFHFEIVDMDHGVTGKYSPKKWQMSELKSLVNKWQTFMINNDGWNALYLENHDQARSVSRFTSDEPEYHGYAAKMLATFLALQSGTVFLYQGQELGMTSVPTSWPISDYKDLECLNHWKEQLELYHNDEEHLKTTLEEYQKKSRDNARIPMQWDASPQAGFTTGEPWMRVHDNYKTLNAAAQIGTPESVFSYWQSVLKLRKSHRDVFIYGDFEMQVPEDEDVFAYTRSFQDQKIYVICNFRKENMSFQLPAGVDVRNAKVLLSNYGVSSVEKNTTELRSFETLVVLT